MIASIAVHAAVGILKHVLANSAKERSGFAFVSLPEKGGFLILGGETGMSFACRYVALLQLHPPRVLKGPSMNCCRKHLAALHYKSVIWAIGGDSGTSVLSSIEVSSIDRPITENIHQQELEGILKFQKFSHNLDIPRAGHATVLILDRFLIVIGGYNNTLLLESVTQKSVEVWDLQQMSNRHRLGTANRLKKKDIFCKGPPLKRERKFLGAAVMNRRNQIILGGGQNQQNVWQNTMEVISFNPNATCVAEVFEERIAPYTTCKYSWELHSQTIGIEQCTKIFSLSIANEGALLAVGKTKARMISLSTSPTAVDNTRSIFAFKSPREFCNVWLSERYFDGPKILLLGGIGKKGEDFLEMVSVSQNLVPPFPNLATVQQPTSLQICAGEWRKWKDETQQIIHKYIDVDYRNWRDSRDQLHQRQKAFVEAQIDSLRHQIDGLENKIAVMEIDHARRLENSDVLVQAWSIDKEEEIQETIERLTRERAGNSASQQALSSSNSENAHPNTVGPPPHLCCPITTSLMKDPVIVVEDGQTYDRYAIEEWWNVQTRSGQRPTSPMTGPISSRQLAPNLLVRSQCREWEQQNPGHR